MGSVVANESVAEAPFHGVQSPSPTSQPPPSSTSPDAQSYQHDRADSQASSSSSSPSQSSTQLSSHSQSPSLTLTISTPLPHTTSPFPSPSSSFLPPPMPGAHEFAVKPPPSTKTTKNQGKGDKIKKKKSVQAGLSEKEKAQETSREAKQVDGVAKDNPEPHKPLSVDAATHDIDSSSNLKPNQNQNSRGASPPIITTDTTNATASSTTPADGAVDSVDLDVDPENVVSPTTPTPSSVHRLNNIAPGLGSGTGKGFGHVHSNSNEVPSVRELELGLKDNEAVIQLPAELPTDTLPTATTLLASSSSMGGNRNSASGLPSSNRNSLSNQMMPKSPQRMSQTFAITQKSLNLLNNNKRASSGSSPASTSNPPTPSSPGFHFPPSSFSAAGRNRDSAMSTSSAVSATSSISSLSSNRPAPPSPAMSRRTSGIGGVVPGSPAGKRASGGMISRTSSFRNTPNRSSLNATSNQNPFSSPALKRDSTSMRVPAPAALPLTPVPSASLLPDNPLLDSPHHNHSIASAALSEASTTSGVDSAAPSTSTPRTGIWTGGSGSAFTSGAASAVSARGPGAHGGTGAGLGAKLRKAIKIRDYAYYGYSLSSEQPSSQSSSPYRSHSPVPPVPGSFPTSVSSAKVPSDGRYPGKENQGQEEIVHHDPRFYGLGLNRKNLHVPRPNQVKVLNKALLTSTASSSSAIGTAVYAAWKANYKRERKEAKAAEKAREKERERAARREKKERKEREREEHARMRLARSRHSVSSVRSVNSVNSVSSVSSATSAASAASASSASEVSDEFGDGEDAEDDDDLGWSGFKLGFGRLSWHFGGGGGGNPSVSSGGGAGAGASPVASSATPSSTGTSGAGASGEPGGGFPSRSDLERNFGGISDGVSSSSGSEDTENEAEYYDAPLSLDSLDQLDSPSPLDYDRAAAYQYQQQYPDSYDHSYEEGYDDYEEEEELPPLLPGLYRAVYAFEPEGPSEMRLEEGEVVRVVGRGGGVGWAVVVSKMEPAAEGVVEGENAAEGDEGVKKAKKHALVPESYLEVVELDEGAGTGGNTVVNGAPA